MAELPRVAPESEMGDEILLRHFNARHMPIAGLTAVTARESDPGEKLLRTWHARCHQTGFDDSKNPRPVNHEHRDG